ncbi:hypothetical protein D3C84_845060 [compost metagenome]
MADKLQPYAVEVADQARIKINLANSFFAQLLLVDGDHAHQHVVEVDPQVRQRWQECRRWRVLKLKLRIVGDAITPHGEFQLIGVMRA